MRCGNLGMMMDDFLLVHNIAQSSNTLLHNNLSLQIYDTFITSGRGMRHLSTAIGRLYGLWIFKYKSK